MKLPKFLLGDHTEHPDAIFVIHTEFPRFAIDLTTDEIEWFEDLAGADEQELTSEMATLIAQATEFYDEEMERYTDE